MASKVEHSQNVPTRVDGSESASWFDRVNQLQDRLTLCPTDILTRCDLAMVLEQLAQHEEALFNWKAVLASDPNNLKAREGVSRCRQRTGRSLQSMP